MMVFRVKSVSKTANIEMNTKIDKVPRYPKLSILVMVAVLSIVLKAFTVP